MQRDENVQELLRQAEKLGLRFEFDGGFLLVRRPATGDRREENALLGRLIKYRSDIHQLTESSAIAARAKDLIGQKVWAEDGLGTLVSSSNDGGLAISVSKDGLSRPITLTSNARNLFIILEAGTAGATAPGDEPTSETARGGFFDRLRSRRD